MAIAETSSELACCTAVEIAHRILIEGLTDIGDLTFKVLTKQSIDSTLQRKRVKGGNESFSPEMVAESETRLALAIPRKRAGLVIL